MSHNGCPFFTALHPPAISRQFAACCFSTSLKTADGTLSWFLHAMQQLEAPGTAPGAFLCPEDDEAALQSDATLPEYDEEEEMLEFDPWSFIKGLPPLADCVPAFRKALLPRQTRR